MQKMWEEFQFGSKSKSTCEVCSCRRKASVLPSLQYKVSFATYIHGIDQMKEGYCEEKNQNIFKCEDCDLKFNYKRSLTLHRKTKHEGKTYKCKTCHSSFSYKHKLAEHVKRKHKDWILHLIEEQAVWCLIIMWVCLNTD